MNITNKQIIANRKNAQKSTGPTTESGKAIAARNSLKHGLLAKEVVIDAGLGAESREQFDELLADLQNHFSPQGTLEEILVEKIAVTYWRLRRAYRFEVGLIRDGLDNPTDGFDDEDDEDYIDKNKMDKEIDWQIELAKERIKDWQADRKELIKMHKDGKSSDEIIDFDWGENWEWLAQKVKHLVADDENYGPFEPEELRKSLINHVGWTDDKIWQAHIELCDDRIKDHKEGIVALEKEKENNKLTLRVRMKLGSIPEDRDLNRLLKYEGSIERQFYKANDQLERIQRQRKGDNVPPPVNIDLDVNPPQGG